MGGMGGQGMEGMFSPETMLSHHGICTSMAELDMDSYLVCSDPKIWVVDGLLSQHFLDRLDVRMKNDASAVATHEELGQRRCSRSLVLDEDTDSQELFEALRRLAKVEEVHSLR